MRFRTRLIAGYATLLAITLAIGATLFVAMHTANLGLERVARELATDAIEIYTLRFQAEQLVATSRGYLLTGDPATLRRFDTEAGQVHAMLGPWSNRAAGIERAAQDYISAARQAARQRTATDDPQAIVPFFERTLAPARARLEDAIAELVHREQEEFEAASRQARRFADRAQMFAIAATGVAILLGLALTRVSIRKLNAQYAREQEATELARRAVEVRDELLAVVSHDLRNPLQAIAMGAAVLEEIELAPQARRPLSGIKAAAARMQYLIAELLDVAKLDSGTLVLRCERCSAGELLEATASLFRERAGKAEIALECRAQAGSSVVADRERLLQVLSNLVGNAFRFVKVGGRVALAVEDVDTATRFAVTDTGPGISPDEVPHLFERHWQGGGRRREGLGLGLYICKKIVEAHGGCIGVETEPGRGSTFWFTVPGGGAGREGAEGAARSGGGSG